RGQGGLLDVALHPGFDRNRTIYLSYAANESDGAVTRVARGVLDGNRLTGVSEIFDAVPRMSGGHHFGSRLAFGKDGKLYVTTGERNERDPAQDLNDLRGKVVRLNDDGSIPAD